MIKKQMKVMALVCVVTFVAVSGMWASGSKDATSAVYFSSGVEKYQRDFKPAEFEANDTVRTFFASKGVASEYVTCSTEDMPIAVRNTVRSIYANDTNKSDVDALALAYLKAQLQAGTVETATMTFGPITWTAAYAQDAEEI